MQVDDLNCCRKHASCDMATAMARDGTPVSTVIPMSAASAQPDPHRANTMRDLQRFMLKSSSVGITQQTVASDLESLNALLPGGGFPTASLVEWVSDQPGLSATTIAMNCIRPFLKQPGCLAVVDGRHDFYALAAQAAGLSRLSGAASLTRAFPSASASSTSRSRAPVIPARLAQRLAQASDMHVHRARLDINVRAPDRIQ